MLIAPIIKPGVVLSQPPIRTAPSSGWLRSNSSVSMARKLRYIIADGLTKVSDSEIAGDRKSTRLNSSHTVISYAVFCLKKQKIMTNTRETLLILEVENLASLDYVKLDELPLRSIWLVDAPASGISMPAIFFFNDTATTEIYTLSLHDALPISSELPWLPPLGRDRSAPR